MAEMKVQIGEVYMDKVTNQKTIYPNKTRKYLLPTLKEYGDIFTQRLNNVFKVAVGIGDVIVDNCGLKHEKHIFILLDSTVAPKYFIAFLDWVRDQSMYEDDYVYDNIQKSKYHMIIIKYPERLYNSFDNFKVGEYSKMFSEDDMHKFFEKYPDVQKILIKDNNYKIRFTKRVNKIFNTWVKPDEWLGELDFPPTNKTEKFNHHLINSYEQSNSIDNSN